MTNPLEAITRMVSAHPAAHWEDPRNGKMPLGFAKGAALTWGRLVGKFQRGEPAAVFCANKNTGNPAVDALSCYAGFFKEIGLDNSVSGLATLRHTFLMACCLAGPESGWKWWCGVDETNPNSETAESAEAGLCQTSWDSNVCAPSLTVPLFEHYLKVPEPLLWRDVFSEGTGGDENHPITQIGRGQGAEFQALSKLAPPFALEYACIVLRCNRRHYGTVEHEFVHLNPHMDDMFQQVEKIMATDPETYAAALSDSPLPTVAAPPIVPAAPKQKAPPMTTQLPPLTPQMLQFGDEIGQAIEAAVVAAAANYSPILGSVLKAVLDAERQAILAQGGAPAAPASPSQPVTFAPLIGAALGGGSGPLSLEGLITLFGPAIQQGLQKVAAAIPTQTK